MEQQDLIDAAKSIGLEVESAQDDYLWIVIPRSKPNLRDNERPIRKWSPADFNDLAMLIGGLGIDTVLMTHNV